MRTNALQRLVTLEGEFNELAADAREDLRGRRGQPADTLAMIEVADVDRALMLYEQGRLSAEQLCEWAGLLELNEYVEYASGTEEEIADVLFHLSSPEVNGPITRDVVPRMRTALKRPRKA